MEGSELRKENLEKEHGICNSAGHDKQRVAEEIPVQKDPKNKTKRESAPLEALADKLPPSGQGKRRKEESEKGLGSQLL